MKKSSAKKKFEQLFDSAKVDESNRKAHSISLDWDQYADFKDLCNRKGLHSNKVIDNLIKLFIKNSK